MNFFLRQTPIILTDALFEDYGGHISNSSVGQRKAAYVISEIAAEQDLGTFLLPTIVTGTYLYNTEIQLDHTYVQQVYLARLKAFDGDVIYTVSGTSNWDMSLRSPEYGLVDFSHFMYCGGGLADIPYQVEIVYQAGLPSGTTFTPNILAALSIYADIELNELIGYGNEGAGDVGITEFSNQDYTEKRMPLLRTAFGNSPRANHAHKLLTSMRKYRYVGLGVPIR